MTDLDKVLGQLMNVDLSHARWIWAMERRSKSYVKELLC